ncbi:HU family DNA-binding protein [Parabacteroides sp. PF5-6]|uniref:HU family DNA-binding protein n=1 Tax=Parabacteroides sp. PF5-6 TaxID=1742403 RepID=UPI00240734C1|nr:HU family DNA-binding protein [Parabacteroides sp. PF5-6]MDF9829574.1 putative histone-like DNA-binding protein [Parabacteroides sp. PF5-6]
MSIIYKPRKMVSVIPGKEKTGYFAGKVPSGMITTHTLCQKISDRCSLTSADVKGVLEALTEEIEMELKYGRSIQMGELGIFTASITSDVVSTKEDLKPRKVKVKSISFRPSVRLKEEMEKVEFVRQRELNT